MFFFIQFSSRLLAKLHESQHPGGRLQPSDSRGGSQRGNQDHHCRGPGSLQDGLPGPVSQTGGRRQETSPPTGAHGDTI